MQISLMVFIFCRASVVACSLLSSLDMMALLLLDIALPTLNKLTVSAINQNNN